MIKPVLEVKNLTKTFTPFFSAPITAVTDFSCTIQRGEIVGLLGLNGAGKTTLLQMLLGALLPTSGKITYFGKDFLQHRSDVLERVGFSASYSNLPWAMKVSEALSFSAQLYKLRDRKKSLQRVILQFKLSGLLQKRINQLSSGQLARVNLAKAFLNQPQLLFLDEPTNYLDPQAAQMIRDYILEKNRTEKLTVLIASHNMQEVMELCDRVIFMHQGKVVLTGKPKQVMETYFTHQIIFSGVVASAKNRSLVKQLELHGKFENQTLTVFAVEEKIGNVIQLLTKAGMEYDNLAINPPSLAAFFDPSFMEQHATA